MINHWQKRAPLAGPNYAIKMLVCRRDLMALGIDINVQL